MFTPLDEQELARRCSQGDRLAEDELYKRYAARVYTLCRRYLGDDEEAKDLMQESLIQALEKIQTFNGSKGSLYGWISRIAINKALNQIKRRRWRTVSLDAWAQDTIPEPTEEEMETIPDLVVFRRTSASGRLSESVTRWIARQMETRICQHGLRGKWHIPLFL